jgi:hypothetical protein
LLVILSTAKDLLSSLNFHRQMSPAPTHPKNALSFPIFPDPQTMRTPFILSIGPASPLSDIKARRRERTICKTRVYREFQSRMRRRRDRSLGQRKPLSDAIMFYPPPSNWPNPASDLMFPRRWNNSRPGRALRSHISTLPAIRNVTAELTQAKPL